jgi:folate-binding protein YgfZ
MDEVAFFDRTGRGRLIVTGRDRMDLLHRLATNSILGVEPGNGTSTVFTNRKGGMIDYTVVLNRGDDLLLLSGNPERLSGHILQYTITEDVTVRNYMAIELVVCGPGAARVLGVELGPWSWADVQLGEVKVQIVRVEPLNGEAYVVLAPDAVALRRMLADHGRALTPPEVEALRVRAGIPTAPNEVNEDHNPWEAGLDEAIALNKGCYVGQEVIARLNTYDKVRRRLRGLKLGRPREAGERLQSGGEPAAELTTVAGSIAMAYVEIDYVAPGTQIEDTTVLDLPIR